MKGVLRSLKRFLVFCCQSTSSESTVNEPAFSETITTNPGEVIKSFIDSLGTTTDLTISQQEQLEGLV